MPGLAMSCYTAAGAGRRLLQTLIRPGPAPCCGILLVSCTVLLRWAAYFSGASTVFWSRVAVLDPKWPKAKIFLRWPCLATAAGAPGAACRPSSASHQTWPCC
jgi:hypothetical protein